MSDVDRRRTGAAIAVCAALLLPVIDAGFWLWGGIAQVDDAFISYRYAANLVAGDGLVWNVGERVEGFSNPLFTGLVAGGLALGFEATRIGAWLGVAGGLALLAGCVWLARLFVDERWRWLAPLAALPLAASGSWVFWSTAGMETSLHAALACAALISAARRSRAASVAWLVLLTFTRMDGALLAAVLLGFDLAPRWRTPRAWWPGLAFGGALALGELARVAYYGDWLPNTYWAKVGGTPLSFGVGYLLDFFRGGPGLLLPTAAVAAWRLPVTRPAALFVLLHGVYVLRVGGDAFAFDRFMLVVFAPLCALSLAGLLECARIRPWLAWLAAPLLPLAVAAEVWQGVPVAYALAWAPAWLVFGLGLRRDARMSRGLGLRRDARMSRGLGLRRDARMSRGLGPRTKDAPAHLEATRVAAIAAGLAGALLFACVSAGSVRGLVEARADAARNRALVQEWRWAEHMVTLQRRRSEALLEQAEPPKLVAAGAIGSLGFYSGLPVLDVLGLTDRHIAHSRVEDQDRGLAMPGHARSDADYVFARAPDVIVIPKRGEGPVWMFALQDIWAHPELERRYAWDDTLRLYRRRDPSAPAGDATASAGDSASEVDSDPERGR